MERRAASVEETRRRIVEATMRCHARQGILATSFQDVAREADVAIGTVYRHFSTLEELVGACGEMTFAWLDLPSSERVAAQFRGARSRRERCERLVSAVAALYRRGAIAFVTVREAVAELSAAAEGHRRMEGAIDMLVDEALRPLQVEREQRLVVRGLLDARVWQTLTDRGLDGERIERELTWLVTCALR